MSVDPSGPLPRESPDRCAFRAEVRGDPLLGTAFPAARLLLVEQPGSWGPDGLTESDFDHRVAHELKDRAQGLGIRVQAIRRPGRDEGIALRRWGFADTREGRAELRWGTYEQDHELLALSLDGTAGVLDSEPAFLVCTHGRHDPCCALRGRPVAAALAELRPGQVWETSHTGGDRFAANLLALPSGLLYGRVEVTDLPELTARIEADEVWVEHLRGRIGLPPVAQAALAFAYRELGALRGLRVSATAPIVDGRAEVRIGTPGGELAVSVRVTSMPAAGLTCHNPGPNRFLHYEPEFASEL